LTQEAFGDHSESAARQEIAGEFDLSVSFAQCGWRIAPQHNMMKARVECREHPQWQFAEKTCVQPWQIGDPTSPLWHATLDNRSTISVKPKRIASSRGVSSKKEKPHMQHTNVIIVFIWVNRWVIQQ
jgi:hypothetical protein